MEILYRQSDIVVNDVSTKFVRNLYQEINWDERLIGIKGARGVGKSTLLKQRIKLAFLEKDKALYVSLDDIWFAEHNLKDLAFKATDAGVTHLFLDEVHKYPDWQRQIKNLYDFFPNLNIVFTGSSLLKIDNNIGDLSRRLALYNLSGLSFREYMGFEDVKLPLLSLEDILRNHVEIASTLTADFDVLKNFKKYLRRGFYPFYLTSNESSYFSKIRSVISTVIENDLPSVENIEYETQIKTKMLVSRMAAETPSPLNVNQLSKIMGISRNQLIRLLVMLEKAQILRLLYYKTVQNPRALVKPNKVLMDNAGLLYALGKPDTGKIRETFLASMLSQICEIGYPDRGDLMVDNFYIFEVGGAGKKFDQIKDIPSSYIASDDITVGFGNKIPLWIFGLLY